MLRQKEDLRVSSAPCHMSQIVLFGKLTGDFSEVREKVPCKWNLQSRRPRSNLRGIAVLA